MPTESEVIIKGLEIANLKDREFNERQRCVNLAASKTFGHDFDPWSRSCKHCGFGLEIYHHHHRDLLNLLAGSLSLYDDLGFDPKIMFCSSPEGVQMRDFFFPPAKPESQESKSDLSIGQRCMKVGGDYQHTGTIVAVFLKTDGKTRVVVEFDAPVQGMLHILKPEQIEPINQEARLR